MKKLLSLILCIMLICTIGSIGVNAATNYCELFDDKIGTLRWAFVIGGGNKSVAEGQAFDIDTIVAFCEMELGNKYADYNKEFYYIPADVFETNAKNSFAICDINALRSSTYDYGENEQSVERPRFDSQNNAYEFLSAGGMGDSSRYVVQGYVKSGSKYTVYSHFVDYTEDAIKPDEVEGKDYVMIDGAKFEVLHSLKNIVETDGKNVKFYSWQETTSIPSGLITPSTKVEDEKPTASSKPTSSATSSSTTSSKPTQSTNTSSSAATSSEENTVSGAEVPLVTVAKTETAVLETEKDVFPENTVVKVEEIKEDKKIETVKTALKEVSQKFVAYEITATSNNVSIQPNGKVKATFDIPEGYDLEKIAVFYVADDGETEKLNSSVDKASKTVSAELSHFSTYVVAEAEVEEADDDSDSVSGEKPINKNWSTFFGIIIAAAVVLLAVGGVAVYFFVKKKKN